MAVYNEILTGRYNRLLQKLLSMKGPASLEALDPNLTAAFPLFNGAENRYLEAWDRYGYANNIGAVGAQNIAVRLRNPVGSNVVAVFEKIMFGSATVNAQIDLSRAAITTDLTTVAAPGAFAGWDNRGRGRPTTIISQQQGAGLGDLNNLVGLWFEGVSNQNIDLIITDVQEIPLLPGDALQITIANVNANLFFTWWWRERLLEESERA